MIADLKTCGHVIRIDKDEMIAKKDAQSDMPKPAVLHGNIEIDSHAVTVSVKIVARIFGKQTRDMDAERRHPLQDIEGVSQSEAQRIDAERFVPFGIFCAVGGSAKTEL